MKQIAHAKVPLASGDGFLDQTLPLRRALTKLFGLRRSGTKRLVLCFEPAIGPYGPEDEVNCSVFL